MPTMQEGHGREAKEKVWKRSVREVRKNKQIKKQTTKTIKGNVRKVKEGSVRTVVMLGDPISQDLNKGRAADLLGDIRGNNQNFPFFNEVPKRKEGSIKT